MKTTFQSKLKMVAKSSPVLNTLARKIYIYPHLNVAAGKNYRHLKKLLLEKNPKPRVLMVGGGTHRLGDDISNLGEELLVSAVNLELFPGDVVDVCGDAGHLPFADKKFDLVVSQALIEHVPDPGCVVREMERVLAPGGYVYFEVPFLQPFHAYPDDFQRYTIQGIEARCSIFRKIDSGIACGPSSAFAWILIEYLSLLFSFNNDVLYEVFNIILRWVLSPLKYLDLILNRFEKAAVIASGV